MSERKTQDELEQIKKKLKVSNLFSWSRYNSYKNDKYGYFLNYVLKVKPDRDTSIYGIQGGVVHQILQDFYEGKIKYEDMISLYEDELIKLQIGEFKYNRSDEDKNEATANKYEDCIRHFFRNHNIIKNKIICEQFILVNVGKHYFQGYVDAVYHEDGKYHIVDFKTSTIYQGKKVEKEQGQLLLYSEALIQKGVKLEDIVAKWNFLKYVTIEIPQANGKTTYSNKPRNEIGKSLKTNVKMWLKKTKRYNEMEIEDILEVMEQTNSIDNLPDDVKDKYVIRDCYVEVNLTPENIEDLKQDINDTLKEILEKEVKYQSTKDDKLFWQEVNDENSFFFSNLSSYSRKHHKPYDEYLTEKESAMVSKDGEGNIDGFDSDGEDLSWLEELQ
jgi:hypothetical protein